MRSVGRRASMWFFAAGAVVALVLAGTASYLADSDPDGLESVTQQGCTQVGDRLEGSCPAQDAAGHALADSPLADYTVGGDSGLVGVAGVAGVLLTLAAASALFWLLRRGRRDTTDGKRGQR